MAFRRKDIKKASYYVWFLGAKESKGLRGDEYVVPVLAFLLDKERQIEPSKVTLQVSNKGLKIVQTLNVARKSGSGGSSGASHAIINGNSKLITNDASNGNYSVKTEQIKHVIPHHSMTWVSQEEDIICCILLIYNPLTKCPVHVHAYRCDSIETATSLRNQLQILIDRPENQKKLKEIEMRLLSKGLIPGSIARTITPSNQLALTSSGNKQLSNKILMGNESQKTLNSDGRSTRTDGSENTDDSFDSSDLECNSNSHDKSHGKHHKRIINANQNVQQESSTSEAPIMFESLAAELKAKLGNPKTGPILLPPRDYDTINRKRGKLQGIELRKSTNAQIVGPLKSNHYYPQSHERKVNKNSNINSSIKRSESSGKSSSGIGSDEALSSAIRRHEIHRNHNHINDDEEEGKFNCSSDDDDWDEDDDHGCFTNMTPASTSSSSSPTEKQLKLIRKVINIRDQPVIPRSHEKQNNKQQGINNKKYSYDQSSSSQSTPSRNGNMKSNKNESSRESESAHQPVLQPAHHPQHQFYFPDPRFAVSDHLTQPNARSKMQIEQEEMHKKERIQRRKSNPDFMQSLSPQLERSFSGLNLSRINRNQLGNSNSSSNYRINDDSNMRQYDVHHRNSMIPDRYMYGKERDISVHANINSNNCAQSKSKHAMQCFSHTNGRLITTSPTTRQSGIASNSNRRGDYTETASTPLRRITAATFHYYK